MNKEDPKSASAQAAGSVTAVDAAALYLTGDTRSYTEAHRLALVAAMRPGEISEDAAIRMLVEEVCRLRAALVAIRDGMPNWSKEVRESWAVQLARDTLNESQNTELAARVSGKDSDV